MCVEKEGFESGVAPRYARSDIGLVLGYGCLCRDRDDRRLRPGMLKGTSYRR